jgi:hypothetical protein
VVNRRGWEITAYVDRRGNRWRPIRGNRLVLVSDPAVRLGKQIVELDYGPLRPTDVDDLDALIEECLRLRADNIRLRNGLHGGQRHGAAPTN